jgi:hypothetical protein
VWAAVRRLPPVPAWMNGKGGQPEACRVARTGPHMTDLPRTSPETCENPTRSTMTAGGLRAVRLTAES